MGRSFYRYACSLLAYNSHAGRRIACGIMTGSLLMGLYGCSAAENTVAVDTHAAGNHTGIIRTGHIYILQCGWIGGYLDGSGCADDYRKDRVTLKMDYPADSNDNRIELMVATGEYPDFVFAKGFGINADPQQCIDRYVGSDR